MQKQAFRFGLNSNICLFITAWLLLILLVFETPIGNAQGQNPAERPEWTRQTTFQKDGYIYFTGGYLNGTDYSLSIRCANAEALKLAAQSISQYVRSVFVMFSQGANGGSMGIDRFVEDGIATLVNNLHLQGIRQKEVYFEKSDDPAYQSAYNVFVMLEMSEQDYLNAKTAVLEGVKKRLEAVGETEAKEKAEQLLDKLQSQVTEMTAKGL